MRISPCYYYSVKYILYFYIAVFKTHKEHEAQQTKDQQPPMEVTADVTADESAASADSRGTDEESTSSYPANDKANMTKNAFLGEKFEASN